MIRVFILVILLLKTSSGSLIEKANEALKNNDTKIAIKLYKEAARNGDEEGNFKLGTLYYKGQGVRRNLNIAMEYFQKAAQYDHIKAKYNMAIIYSQKRYKFHNFKKAFKLFNELAKEGHGKAQNKVGIFLTYGLGVDKDYSLAVKWFEHSYFESNYLPASCNLSFMFAEGKGVFPNFGRARKLAQEGYDKKLPMCVKVYEDYNLRIYTKDKGFKSGYYK